MRVTTRGETFKIGDQGSKKSQIEIIAVHPFKTVRFERDRAHLKKLIAAALEASGASTIPKDKPRVSYYAVDPDDFRFGLKNSGKTRFVEECHNLAKSVKSLLGKDPLKSDKRLIFLAHGLGAALTKHCLANQYEYRETITKRTSGVAFLDSWSDSRDRKAITDFVDGWIQRSPSLLDPNEVRLDQDQNSSDNEMDETKSMERLDSNEVLLDQDQNSPDNEVTETKSMQRIEADERKEFIDLLLQVDNNFREIMDPGRQRDFQLFIDGRVFQLQWLGSSRDEKRGSQKLRLPAPVIRTPSTRNIDPATKDGLTCIMKFLKDTSHSRDDLPPELNGFRYFTENDEKKLMTHSQETNGSMDPTPVADGIHGGSPRSPRPNASRKPVSKPSNYPQRSSWPPSAGTNMSRRVQSDALSYQEEDRMAYKEQTQANPKVGFSLPPRSVEAATRMLYHQFVDMSAPSGPEEGDDRVNSDSTMGWLAAKAASYVELRELDNADKVYEQIIRLRQALSPGDAYLFVLHLRRAKVWHEMGRYKDANAYISRIQDAASSMQVSRAMAPVSESLARDLEWYRILTKFRLGEHDKVDKLLVTLTGYRLQQQVVARVIKEPSPAWNENVQIVFRCKRVLALNKAKTGHFGEAQAQIDELYSIIEKFIPPYNTASQQHAYNSKEHPTRQLQQTLPNAKFEKQQPRKALALLAYTSAYVCLLHGQYKTALTECHNAVQMLREISGADSLDALEARKLEAHLLAYDWKPDSAEVAEVACKESLRCVSRNFGAQHPVSLETMDVLVFILRRQARLSEALVTAQGLCRHCDQVLGRDRPQTRQSKSQLAAIHMSSGNYRDAVNLLKEIAFQSLDEHKSPDSLRYEAELALALFRLGKFDTAAATIQRTILAQKVVFTRAHANKRAHGKPLSNKFDDELTELMGNLQGKPGQESKYMPHPDLLYSLEVLAQITSRTNLSLAFERLALVLALREDPGSHGDISGDQYTMEKTRFDVILMKRELSAAGYTYEDAERELDELTKTLQEVLGPYHPDTAAAKSELVLTRAILGREPRHALTQLGALQRQQKLEIGQAHPDTLRTRLAILVVQLLLGDTQATTTCRSLLEALRAPEVRNQRLVEALTMEERIAVLYANQGRFAECQGILDGMVASLENELAPQVKELGLNDMVARVKGLLEQISLYEATAE